MSRNLRTLKIPIGKIAGRFHEVGKKNPTGADWVASSEDSDEDVILDVEKLVATRMLICANSGGGKSHALRLIAENVAMQLPTIIIDPEGEFRTLREIVDLVIVGPNGDVAATIATAEKLARRLAELNVSAVIDISDLSPQDQRLFVKLFVNALLHLPQALWSPRLIIIDEAHKFAPEDERDAVSRAPVEALMAQGRKRQLGTILATQRLRKLSKNAAAEGNNLLLGRFAQDLDLKRAADLLGIGKNDWVILQRFKEGQFFALGPAISPVRGRLLFRTAMTATSAPKVGGRIAKTPQPSKSIQKLVPEFADLQVQVEAEQSELLTLRAKVKELSSRKPTVVQRETVRVEGPSLAQIEAAYLRGYSEADTRLRDEIGAFVNGLRSWVTKELDAMYKRVESKKKLPRDLKPKVDAKTTSGRVQAQAPNVANTPRPSPAPRKQVVDGASPTDVLGRGAPAKLLAALLMYDEPISRGRAALLAGVAPNTSTFRNAMSKLRVHEFLDDVGDLLKATDAARAQFPNAEQMPTGHELIEYWKAEMGTSSAPGRLFSALVENGMMSRKEAAEEAGMDPDTSTFRNAMSKLRVLGLLVDNGHDVMAAPELAG